MKHLMVEDDVLAQWSIDKSIKRREMFLNIFQFINFILLFYILCIGLYYFAKYLFL